MSSTYITINGTALDNYAAIVDYEETFNVLDGENAGRVLTGGMVRDIIGTYVGHKITFRRTAYDKFDALWDLLISLSTKDSVTVTVADGQGTITYDAYFSSGSRKLKKVENGVNYWDEMELTLVTIDPQYTP